MIKIDTLWVPLQNEHNRKNILPALSKNSCSAIEIPKQTKKTLKYALHGDSHTEEVLLP